MYSNQGLLREFLASVLKKERPGGPPILLGPNDEKIVVHANSPNDYFGDDSDLEIRLYNDGQPLVTSGITTGLQNYYAGHQTYIDKEPHFSLIDLMKGKPIIVQMDYHPEGNEAFQSLDWQSLNIKWWSEYLEKQGESDLYLLPAEFNRWILPRYIRKTDSDEIHEKKSTLNKNFDQAALANGFKADQPYGVFHKKLNPPKTEVTSQ